MAYNVSCIKVLVLDAIPPASCQALRILLEGGYEAEPVATVEGAEAKMAQAPYLALVIDIDTVTIDNARIRSITLKYPGAPILCASKNRFHPELKDAICYHIFACLNKPIDPEELLFWMRCIREDGSE